MSGSFVTSSRQRLIAMPIVDGFIVNHQAKMANFTQLASDFWQLKGPYGFLSIFCFIFCGRTFQSHFFAPSENSLDFFVGRPRLVFVFTECDVMASHVYFLGLTVRPGWLSVRHFGN